jgi:hypothetical protein
MEVYHAEDVKLLRSYLLRENYGYQMHSPRQTARPVNQQHLLRILNNDESICINRQLSLSHTWM